MKEYEAQSIIREVRFQVLTAASIKMAVFRVVVPCSLAEFYLSFRGAIALMMVAASTSETSINFYQTTWHNNPEDSHLHSGSTRRKKCALHLIKYDAVMGNQLNITPCTRMGEAES
jgi:hypothetical protein